MTHGMPETQVSSALMAEPGTSTAGIVAMVLGGIGSAIAAIMAWVVRREVERVDAHAARLERLERESVTDATIHELRHEMRESWRDVAGRIDRINQNCALMHSRVRNIDWQNEGE